MTLISLSSGMTKKKDNKGKKRADKEVQAVITTLLIILAFVFSYLCYYLSLFIYLVDGFKVCTFFD